MAQQVLSIGASGDDDHGVVGGSFSPTSTSLFFGDDGTESGTFLRFALSADLTGATIDSAYITGVFAEAVGTTVEIDAVDAADPAAFTGSTASFFSETGTTAYVVWTPDPTGGGGSRTSPDIKTVIQELVDSYTMASGDHIVIMLRVGGQTTSTANEISSWDHATDAAPSLEINYTEGGNVASATLNAGGSITAVTVGGDEIVQQILQPVHSQDDAHANVGDASFQYTATTLFFGDNGVNESGAYIRFTLTSDLTGATINSATLTGIFQETYGTTVEIDARDNADDQRPGSPAIMFAAAGTTAKVVWNPDPTGGGGSRTSPDIKTVIQELVDSYTMASGDHITIMLRVGSQTTTYVNEIASYDHATSDPPTLEINYTNPGASTSGEFNAGGSITGAGTKTALFDATLNSGGSIEGVSIPHLQQIARPASTVAAGNWDTGPTPGQNLHDYTSDTSDATWIEDTTS